MGETPFFQTGHRSPTLMTLLAPLANGPLHPAASPPEPKAPAFLGPHLRFAIAMLVALGICRLGLMALAGSRVGSPKCVGQILLSGLRMDLVAVSYVIAPALLASLALVGNSRFGRGVARAVRVYFIAMATLFLGLEAATPTFISEFDSRPNRLFIEYLVHPKEISSMLAVGYKGQLALVAVALVGAGILARWLFKPPIALPPRTSPWKRLALLLTVGPAIFLGARSSLQHRPANPSSVAFSEDHLLNDLCLSSVYSVAFAATQMRDESDAANVYGSLESEEAMIAEVRAAMVTSGPGDFIGLALPTLHRTPEVQVRERPYNLVIILEESLGAQYVDALGGRPITSFLDTLKGQGLWFDQMYATGTRSVRGIEAVVAGFLPTPARSTVKLGLSQQGFFTLADLLGREGYRTSFIYGGESHFDNMKRFFTGNGFREIIDQDDFHDPVFTGSWGVSDEDVMAKAHETFVAMGDEPFFSVVFSVSNHSPWEYPAGRIQPHESGLETVESTVRYADYALGQFFDKARSAAYWDNTVFVVIADHDSRVHGASLVPIEHFHIPAVIIAPGLEPRVESRPMSQIDVGPTALSLMGVPGPHPMVGLDATALPADYPGRAIMQYGDNHAYLQGSAVVIHQPNRPPTHYEWDGSSLRPSEVDPALERRALAHALLPSMLYRNRTYRLPRATATAHRGSAAPAAIGD